MGVLRHHRHRQFTLSFATLAAFLLLASVSAFGFSPSRQFSKYMYICVYIYMLEITVLLNDKVKKCINWYGVSKIKEEVVDRVTARRRLGGPGSSPPSCRSKCGWCSPCKPVHVPIQPGFSMPLEYYPEAWRCKCGNKLFMP
ncbi:hypothetical protein BUALT_Bualt14G0098800 [Buddleja alternifolia]|uniref:Epidermal patterning factor-like protein n=1 Tax=Buddleja alternifolia TaxID=168488 RepID=A0AAV6WR25_9LAMI|nr:hypothetical protein BUALT_Bualt14G0098800 [Buddleja alternifolia]